MIIPTFQNVQYVEKDGYLTAQMQLYNDELNTVLRNGLSDNGWTLPTVTRAELLNIMSLPADQQMPIGTMWYVCDKPPLTPYNEIVVKMDDGTGTGSVLYKLTKTAYP